MERPMTPVPIQPTRVLDGLMGSEVEEVVVVVAMERRWKVRREGERVGVKEWWERESDSGRSRRGTGISFFFIYRVII
jgi:hypothetical protein